MEVWKDIEGFEGLYQISNEGRVKRTAREQIRRNRWGENMTVRYDDRILTPHLNGDGHLQAVLYKDSTKTYHPLHQLVAIAFIPNPNNYDVVHHIDHNPLNNRVENLMWIDKGEHTSMHNKGRGKEIYQYTRDNILVKKWNSIAEASENKEFDASTISKVAMGKCGHKTHKGYKWSYEPL